MAIKFPDSITQNNANYITVSAIDGDVQGIYFVDTLAERDAIGGADFVLDNHRVTGAVVYVGTKPYIYTAASIADVDWTNIANWESGSASLASLNDIDDVTITSVGVGNTLVYDGTEWVNYASGSIVPILGNSAYLLDQFPTTDYNGAVYDYVLVNTTGGARCGQLMLVHTGGNITMTDVSTTTLGAGTPPEFTVSIATGNVEVRIDNGFGYTFKANVTKL